jgi:hypothetical protein
VAETVLEMAGIDISQQGVLPTGAGLAQIGREIEEIQQKNSRKGTVSQESH